ncbi:MAG TPA: CPBP family intramembrane metalloprotease [Thermoflexia bacterium]|nr:CPBP family intramembrane metalloprotease [Thermoflexia bacterium]
MRGPQFLPSQIVLVVAPPVLVATTYLVFRYSAARLGPARGYLVGFLFYWTVWCLLIPLLTVGPEGIRRMFSPPEPTFGRPGWLGVFLLVGPPLFMYLTVFPREIGSAGLTVAIYSALYAVVNGTMEEILWRGTFVTAFSGSWLWGYLYPAVWFGLWHLSPQAVEPSEPGGAVGFALLSILLGLAWGWVARTSGSIRWTVVAHVLLNFAVPAGRWFVTGKGGG